MRPLSAFALLLLLAGCGGSSEPETEAPSGTKSEAIPSDIDFGKLVGGQGATQPGAPPSGAGQSGAAAQGGYYRVKPTKVMDTQGWDQPVEIAQFLIPADWKGQGGANWDQKSIKCVPNIVQTYFRSESPDGLSGLDVAPSHMWNSSPHPEVAQMLRQAAAEGGCPVASPMSAIEYLERTVVPRYRAGASVLDRRPEPEVAKAKESAAAPSIQSVRAQGALLDVRFDSASLRIAYPKNGQMVEEWLSTTLFHMAIPTSSMSGMSRGVLNDASQIVSSAENVIAIRAPQGKFDNDLAAAILASIRPNPAYQAAVTKFQQNMNNIAIQGAMDRARIWREAQAENSRTINEAYRNQQAAQDRAAERFSQYIRGVATYINPATGQQVQVPNGFSGVWMGSGGQIVLSNNPNFNPNTLGGGWTPLTPGG